MNTGYITETPRELLHTILDKIPGLLDQIYNMLSNPIMITILVIGLITTFLICLDKN